MPVEFKYFIESDFDENYEEIFTMCMDALGVALKELVYESTPAPLGEGENGFVIFVDSKAPVKSVTHDMVHELQEALQKRFGEMQIWVHSVCPQCGKTPYRHFGYIGGDPDSKFRSDQCDKCFTKQYTKRKISKKTKCFVCKKTFSMGEKGGGFRIMLHSHIYNELTQKNVANLEYKEGEFDTPQFCSIQCVRTKLDELIKELAAISNGLE